MIDAPVLSAVSLRGAHGADCARGGLAAQPGARFLLIDYLTPAIDTTIHATSSAIELFAAHPEQWTKLRGNPTLLPHAINEVLRLESPIRAFARQTVTDHTMDGVTILAGHYVLMMYACANRDPAKYPDPDRFDIERKPSDQLGFGMGSHICPGMYLAMMEMTIVFEALLEQVDHFVVTEAERMPHNTLRGLSKLNVTAVPVPFR